MDPYDKTHKYAKAGLHFHETPGNYKCNGPNCNHTVKVDIPVDTKNKQKALSSIRAHCKKCFPNLKEMANAQRLESTKKNPAKYRNITNSYAKREQEVAVQENVAKSEGGAQPEFTCSICKNFHTEDAVKRCERNCRKERRRSVSLFLKTHEESIPADDTHDSDEDSQETEVTEFPKQLMETMAHQYNKILAGTTLYFVIVIDSWVKGPGLNTLLEYLRANATNPSFEVSYYVGKRTAEEIEHDVLKDHLGRKSSTIVEELKSGRKVAYEVHRENYNSLAELEAAESFWILLGSCRKRSKKQTGTAGRQRWISLNKKNQISAAHTLLTEREKLDACSLAKKNHEVLCLVEGCSKDHNTKKRKYFGLYHSSEGDIKHMDPDAFQEHDPQMETE